MLLEGSIPALITPWTADGHSIDEDAVKKLVEWHIEQGSSALVPCGTTGESPAFTHEEQHRMIDLVVQTAAGRIPILAGAGSNSTREAISLAANAERLGADAVLTITPYYNKPPQEGLFQHFKAVREATSLPMVLYNVPGRTGINLLPETAARVWELGGIEAVKEASGDLDQCHEMLKLGVRLLSGEDGLTWPMMALGAEGTISVVANFAPRLVADMCAAAKRGDHFEARRLHQAVWDLTQVAFCETNPIPAKTAMAEMGMCEAVFRLPLVSMSAAGKERLLRVLRQHDVLPA